MAVFKVLVKSKLFAKQKSFSQMMRSRLLSTIVSIFLRLGPLFWFSSASAQYYSSGNDPAILQWAQINTEHYKIIFPRGFEAKVQQLANILEYARARVGASLQEDTRRISIVLHNRSAISNGFVTWAPRRMELYPSPPPDNYAQDWFEQLAIHEGRHVVQIDKLNQGFTRLLTFLFGEQGMIVAGIVPKWFLEGDAVVAETSLSNSGRGRVASFEMQPRAISLERGQAFGYDKATRGSYRDYVPTHYQYGYQMVAYGRVHYGEALWNNALTEVAHKPFLIIPFRMSLRKQTGKATRGFYYEAFNYLDSIWAVQDKQNALSPFRVLNNRVKKGFDSYLSGHYVNDSTYITWKKGISHTLQLALLDKRGKENVLCYLGAANNECISFANQKTFWTEEIPDLRWENRSYSDIYRFDLQTRKKYRLTYRKRYYWPEPDSSATRVLAVEQTVLNEFSLVLLDAVNGQELATFPIPGNAYIQSPVWGEGGRFAYMLMLDEKGKHLVKLDMRNGIWENLTDFGGDDVSNIRFSKGRIFYTSGVTGIDNIYVFEPEAKKRWQLTCSRFGATGMSFSADGSRMLYSDYTSYGYNLCEARFDSLKWLAVDESVNNGPCFDRILSQREGGAIDFSNMPDIKYDAKPYRKTFHLFNFHSWAPFWFDYQSATLDNTALPGISLFSQNLLGTAVTKVGLSYQQTQGCQLHASYTFSGWYPIISIEYTGGGYSDYYPYESQIPEMINDNHIISCITQIPLIFSRGRVLSYVLPYAGISYARDYYYNVKKNGYQRGVFDAFVGMQFSYKLRQSLRDLGPAFGVYSDWRYYSTPNPLNLLADMVVTKNYLYLPGVLKHHSLRLGAAYQKQFLNSVRFVHSSVLAFPRGGYQHYTSYELMEFMVDYSFPVAYPDFNISFLAYFKRLRMNLFCDYAHNKNSSGWINYSSTGVDCITDCHLLRSIFPISIGYRFGYLIKEQNYFGSFLLSYDLSNL